ncbi:uncharacterized protein K460DRAFT_316110 [Cucurbitaria berberidis CBS 394.84]|uniref:RlpA-like protein double-psi beta-barrel domain-containing protein n=1 Tax=Cucurbitaria berberidis CBS 394.84 TaxID=1168544 RepID=A0A9P4L647_9PLEO|nr:uncharacterized protein K460DRAFT_316110 [Cucurbitaria berberidis CBS 394.84]KAF1843591.1 hypothetical protein K460DRAFT_316110 [Cucurbitaria berberidis CBS 394.84]
MGAPEIPRKDIGEPSRAYIKEADSTNNTLDSGWDIPQEGQRKRRHAHLGVGSSATGWALSDRFDRMLPPHRRYIGRSRRTFLIIVLVILVCLLALIIGLAVGLSKGSNKTQNLPLPNGSETYTGDLTYYAPALGACGIESSDKDAIVAVSHFTFDAAQVGGNPNANPLCGRKIRAKRVHENTGQSVSIDVTVVDRCEGCQPTDLDVSPAMFKRLADEGKGRVKVTWAWL